MNFELTGVLIAKYDTQVVSDSFKKREFVIEVKEENSTYSQFLKFQSTQTKTDLIEPYKIGDAIKVGFNIRGNKWEKNGITSYFTNLDAWRITAAGNNDDRVYNDIPAQSNAAPQSDFLNNTEIVDDLPF